MRRSSGFPFSRATDDPGRAAQDRGQHVEAGHDRTRCLLSGDPELCSPPIDRGHQVSPARGPVAAAGPFNPQGGEPSALQGPNLAWPHGFNATGHLVGLNPAVNRSVVPAGPSGGVWSNLSKQSRYFRFLFSSSVLGAAVFFGLGLWRRRRLHELGVPLVLAR